MQQCSSVACECNHTNQCDCTSRGIKHNKHNKGNKHKQTSQTSPCKQIASSVVSGYFDPLHVGHLEYFERARALTGHLTVIVNNDAQARKKKNFVFMPERERVRIVQSIGLVDKVVLSIDTDASVCQTLESIEPAPAFFCNGGDRDNNVPEAIVCQRRNITMVDGLGLKIQSSSWLTNFSKPT